MAVKPPFKGTKEEVKDIIDRACDDGGFKDRKSLAESLGLSESAIYGYINRCEIPHRVHLQLAQITKDQKASPAGIEKKAIDLSNVSIDQLIEELRNRGFKVDLKSV